MSSDETHVDATAAWMPGQSMTLTNPGLESLKAGGPLSEDLFAGDASVPAASNGALPLPA